MADMLRMSKQTLNIVRIINPEVIKELKPYFTILGSGSIDLFMSQLVDALRNLPDSVMVLQWLDQDEQVRALLVAVNPGASYNHINVSQLWAHPDIDRSWVKSLMARLIMWAVALNKTYMRAETARNCEAMHRRFGFEPRLTVMEYDLKKSGYFNLLTQHSEEVLSWEIS